MNDYWFDVQWFDWELVLMSYIPFPSPLHRSFWWKPLQVDEDEGIRRREDELAGRGRDTNDNETFWQNRLKILDESSIVKFVEKEGEKALRDSSSGKSKKKKSVQLASHVRSSTKGG